MIQVIMGHANTLLMKPRSICTVASLQQLKHCPVVCNWGLVQHTVCQIAEWLTRITHPDYALCVACVECDASQSKSDSAATYDSSSTGDSNQKGFH